MHPTSWIKTIALLTALIAATPAMAQSLGYKQDEIKHLWMRFEKELGLQSEYSVDMEAQTMGMTIPAKIHRLKNKSRTEMTMPMTNMKLVTIELPENGKSVTYSVFPDQKKYCVADYGKNLDRMPENAYKIEDAGTENFEGVTCKKRRLTINSPEGPQFVDLLMSPAQKNMPVKLTASVTMKMADGQPPQKINTIVLFKNYNFSAPPENLFSIPKDYTKAANMQEVIMSGLFGGGKTQQGGGFALTPEMLKAVRAAQEQCKD